MRLRREKRPMNVGDDYQWSNARRRVQAEIDGLKRPTAA
jgi:hypothetical protein